MKTAITTGAIVVFAFFVGTIIFVNGSNPQTSKSTVYTVKCVDDILTGELIKVNDKYFRAGTDQPTWVPLAQCSLEPKLGE